MKELNKQNLHDILLGAAILGTGGGGNLTEGIKLIDKALDEGFKFKLADLDEIPDDALVGTPYGCGSVSPLTTEQIEAQSKLPKIKTTAEVAAVKVMEKYYEESFYGLVATELGGKNTAVALEASGRLNKPLIDADPAGRSVPCLQHSTYYLKDVPIYPLSIANSHGDEMLITKAVSDERAEALTRAAAVSSFNHVGVVDHPNRWSILKNTLLNKTISLCLQIGQTARKAKDEDVNFAYPVADKFNGYILFEGVIDKATWEDRDGFTFGEYYIEGSNKFDGQKMKIWFQNENIISWLNNEIYVTVPDSINIVDIENNMPLLNPYGEKGMKVTVFGLKAFDEWRSEKGLEVFGPKFFNYDTDYKEIEKFF